MHEDWVTGQSPTATATSWRRPPLSVAAWSLVALTLTAAVSAVLGSFLTLYRLDVGDPISGDIAERLTYGGWGQVYQSSPGTVGAASFSADNAPRYGVVFCAAALLLVASTIWVLSRSRARWCSPSAPGLLGATLLAGSVATLFVLTSPRLAAGNTTQIHLGAGFFCEAGAAVAGLAAAIVFRAGEIGRQGHRVVQNWTGSAGPPAYPGTVYAGTAYPAPPYPGIAAPGSPYPGTAHPPGAAHDAPQAGRGYPTADPGNPVSTPDEPDPGAAGSHGLGSSFW
ncbi:MAG TPA: hypothetical protein VHO01_14240 [Jatrophihabitans sp.]|nr:hypothetical protein [Jatrophihabitans sp.]